VTSKGKVVIIGGGIGGLAAARALSMAGFTSEVYERATELHEIGASLGIQCNAVKALAVLDLAEAILARGEPIEEVEAFPLGHGRRLMSWSQGDIGRRLGAPSVMVHRSDLQDVLLSAVDSNAVHLGAQFVGYAEDEAGVTARFADGRTARGDLLVGADGIRSTVRRQVCPRARVRYGGYTVWRAITPFSHPDFPPNTMRQYLGPGRTFSIWQLADKHVSWSASAWVPEAGQDRPGTRKDIVRSWFAGSQPVITELIEATPEQDMLRTDTADVVPFKGWRSRRVILLGDAAHATTQTTGQGAGQAIEDAVVLARTLAALAGGSTGPALGDPAALGDALGTYERTRRTRTASITREAYLLGRLFHVRNTALARLRDASFRLRPPSAWERQMQRRLIQFQIPDLPDRVGV
jgi:2-polyprenyl-6-methoxyphenol hydroxylase-like FAD-dependent oxidoreductase